ncbi:hypothetical protein GQ457_13G014230 [Hibiscus cannabinus]
MKPQGVSEDQIKLRAFPFSLVDSAKEWFFPAAKASELRRSILRIRQKDGESLYDHWVRFKKLCANCPQHGLSKHTLLQYFYEGFLPLEMKMIDATSGGAIVIMTPHATRELIKLISTMAANTQQFSCEPSRRVHVISTISLENKIDKLSGVVNSLTKGKSRISKVCGICAMKDHPLDCCPCLQEEAHVNAVAFRDIPRDCTIRTVIPITLDGKIILTSAMHRTKDPTNFIRLHKNINSRKHH